MKYPAAVLIVMILITPLAAQSASDFSTQARSLTSHQNFRAAVDTLRQGLELHPADSTLLLQLGSLLIKLGQVTEGSALLAKALLLNPFDTDALRGNAEAQLRQGRLDGAIEFYRKLLWHNSQDGRAHYRLAFTYHLKGDTLAALRHAEKSTEFAPLEPRMRLFYSMLLRLQRELDESHRQLRIAHRLDPGRPDVLYRLSRSSRSRGQSGQALEYAALAAEADPENPLYQRELATLHLAVGDKESAAAARIRADHFEAAFAEYFKALENVRGGQTSAAILRLERVVESSPGFLSGRMALADLHQREGNAEKALEMYSALLEENPDLESAKLQTAWLRFNEGALDRAIELLPETGALSDSRSMIEGYQHLLEGAWNQALEEFRTAEKENPLLPGLPELIGYCLYQLGERDDALEHLARARSLGGESSSILRQMARIRLEQATKAQKAEDWATAVALLNQQIRDFGAQPEYLFSRAYSNQQMGHLVEAVLDYQRGLEAQPEAHWASYNLASCLYRLERYAEAAEIWERYPDKEKNPELLLHLGLCYNHLDRDPEAEQLLTRARNLGLDTPQLFYNLGITQLRLLKVEEAWDLIREAARRGYPPATQLLKKARQPVPRR